MKPVVASDKLKRTEVWAEDDESVGWAGAFAVYGGHGATASSTIVYEIEPGNGSGVTAMPRKRRNTSSPVTANYTWKMVPCTRLVPAAFLSCRRRSNTISSMSAEKHCVRSRFSPRRCLRKTSTT